VTATGGGQTVRTAAAVNREVQSYEVTVKHIGRDGKPAAEYNIALLLRAGGHRRRRGIPLPHHRAHGSHQGAAIPSGLSQTWNGQWTKGDDGEVRRPGVLAAVGEQRHQT
jgi:hypothetical protein